MANIKKGYLVGWNTSFAKQAISIPLVLVHDPSQLLFPVKGSSVLCLQVSKIHVSFFF